MFSGSRRLAERFASIAILKIKMLAATLVGMRRASLMLFRGSRTRQRSLAVVLGFALCVWLVAVATHSHAFGDDAAGELPAACTFCLSLPTAAPTPGEALTALTVFTAIVAVVDVTHDVVTVDIPSSYLSRGPPAV